MGNGATAGNAALPGNEELASQSSSLWEFYRASADWRRGGFSSLDSDGAARAEPKAVFACARMTHGFALAAIDGFDGAAGLVEHGLKALRTSFHDDEHGGWFHALSADSAAILDRRKHSYDHAFVVLAAASASIAGFDASDILSEALWVYENRLADENGLVGDTWGEDWSAPSSYRGANANMHTAEALLAAYDATGDSKWLHRAGDICRAFLQFARTHDWRVPEHFDRAWAPDLDFNRDLPSDLFKPYGSTPGHALQWARLVCQWWSAVDRAADAPDDARALFFRAMDDGWDESEGGLYYTVDWTGEPVCTTRLHWPVAEAITTAATLARSSPRGDPFVYWQETLWGYVKDRFQDGSGGAWIHEVDSAGRVGTTMFRGRPDLYHSLQATIAPRTPVRPSFAQALREASVLF